MTEREHALTAHIGSMVPHEDLVAGLVTEWAQRVRPGDRETAERASRLAARCYAGGASVGEACRAARQYVMQLSSHEPAPGSPWAA